MKVAPTVSIVLLMHNISPWLIECSRWCFRSIKEHTIYPAYELIVVDSASTADGWQKLNEEFVKQGAIVIRHEKNIGMTGGFNAGMEVASSDYVFLVENDVIVTDFWVTNALKCFAENPYCALIKAEEDNTLRDANKKESDYDQGTRYKQIQDTNKEWLKKTINLKPKDLDDRIYGPDGWTSLWCIAFRKEVLKDIDNYFLDEKVGLNWHEDMDLCWRLRDVKWKTFILPSMYVYHRASQTCSLTNAYMVSPEKKAGIRYFEEKHDIIMTQDGWPARRKYREALLKEQNIKCYKHDEWVKLVREREEAKK